MWREQKGAAGAAVQSSLQNCAAELRCRAVLQSCAAELCLCLLLHWCVVRRARPVPEHSQAAFLLRRLGLGSGLGAGFRVGLGLPL